MKPTLPLATIALTVIYSFLFYGQLSGINIILFETVLIVTSLFFIERKKIGMYAGIILCGTLISALFIMLYGSLVAKWVNAVSLFILASFLSYDSLRSPLHAFLLSVIQFINAPFFFIRSLFVKDINGNSKKAFRYFKIILLPILIIVLFMFMYSIGNSRFSKELSGVLEPLQKFINWFFDHIDFEMFCVMLCGVLISSAFIYKATQNNISVKSIDAPDTMQRRMKTAYKLWFKNMDLKKESLAATFLLVALNILIFFPNLLDIKFIWISYEWSGEELKNFVHAGTFVLIVAILFSIFITLHFYKGNINFYSKGRYLRPLVYLWLFQNVIMLISVIIRNVRYIQHFNLAHLRIGLFYFLLAVVLLIVFTYLKIRNKRTTHYLIRTTGMSTYIIMILLCVVDWDVFIASYNFAHAGKAYLHREWLLTLSDKTLPVLDANKELLAGPCIINGPSQYEKPNECDSVLFMKKLEVRKSDFIKDYRQRGWQSWNYADSKAYHELIK
ncbi:MAG: DUF4173 domain-containing protein [Bacteroidia bacterium]|nr:DUF4173 domain-containing protein [Bacteroidia bacterium]